MHSCLENPLIVHGHLKAGPPLDLSFWSFLTFFAPWYRRGREASSVKLFLKNSKETLVKCATEVARLHRVSMLYKVVHKIGRLRKFNRSHEIEFNFFTA